MSTIDGSVDCQPIVYDRCYTGEALDADGDCLSERYDLYVLHNEHVHRCCNYVEGQ